MEVKKRQIDLLLQLRFAHVIRFAQMKALFRNIAYVFLYLLKSQTKRQKAHSGR